MNCPKCGGKMHHEEVLTTSGLDPHLKCILCSKLIPAPRPSFQHRPIQQGPQKSVCRAEQAKKKIFILLGTFTASTEPFRRRDISKRTGLSKACVSRNLSEYVEKGFVERHGEGSNTFYTRTDKFPAKQPAYALKRGEKKNQATLDQLEADLLRKDERIEALELALDEATRQLNQLKGDKWEMTQNTKNR